MQLPSQRSRRNSLLLYRHAQHQLTRLDSGASLSLCVFSPSFLPSMLLSSLQLSPPSLPKLVAPESIPGLPTPLFSHLLCFNRFSVNLQTFLVVVSPLLYRPCCLH